MDSIVNPENNGIRRCDFCSESKALLYCRADSAKLCINCDREVHSTNQLFKKHSRCLLCDLCNSAPASIFCHSESLVLCQNCDWESHNNLRAFHDRRPIEGFNGCPCVSELLNFLGLEHLGKKSSVLDDGNDEGWLDLLVWDTPSIVSLDDLVVSKDSADSGHNFRAIGVPPLPKNRNAACGKHKEEILRQLRDLVNTEADFSGCLEDTNSYAVFKSQEPGESQLKSSPGNEKFVDPVMVPSYETNAQGWCDYTDEAPGQGCSTPFFGSIMEMSHVVPNKYSDLGNTSLIANCSRDIESQIMVESEMFQVIPVGGTHEWNSQERDSAISRYKEKKKTRRYDKLVRYESRKMRAESRTRIKGRFAKMEHK